VRTRQTGEVRFRRPIVFARVAGRRYVPEVAALAVGDQPPTIATGKLYQRSET